MMKFYTKVIVQRKIKKIDCSSYNIDMIKRLEITNIQSHKNSILEFDPGVNVIVGSSNNGKSAILRALYWVRYNRPLGIDTLLSHWAFDKKGNQIAPMEVTIENELGRVTRKRTKTENQYIINDEVLNVVKTDVPEQVEKILSLTDTNIQKQHDLPFLLSLTSGQVAQYFNKTVRLDIIDRVLSNTESKRRKLNQEIKINDELLAEAEKKHDKYNWLAEAEKLILSYEKNLSKFNDLDTSINSLIEQIDEYEKYFGIKNKYDFISEVKNTISKIDKLIQKKEILSEKINNINSDLEIFENCDTRQYNFSEAKKIINEIKKIDFSSIVDKIEILHENINEFETCEQIIEINKTSISEYKNQLPDICPICGNPIKK